MSDEQANGPNDSTDDALTGDVHDAPRETLVPQKHGGALAGPGNYRPKNPTPSDVRELWRKRLYQIIPEVNRIARNKPTKRKPKPGPNKVSDQLRAIEIMMRGAIDDTISVSDFRRAMKGFSEDIMRHFPGETGERILNIAAPWFFPL